MPKLDRQPQTRSPLQRKRDESCPLPSALLAGEKIEVAAVLGLGHAIGVEPDETAGRLLWRLPLRTTLVQLRVVDLEVQLPALGIELDPVAVPNQRQRPAGG